VTPLIKLSVNAKAGESNNQHLRGSASGYFQIHFLPYAFAFPYQSESFWLEKDHCRLVYNMLEDAKHLSYFGGKSLHLILYMPQQKVIGAAYFSQMITNQINYIKVEPAHLQARFFYLKLLKHRSLHIHLSIRFSVFEKINSSKKLPPPFANAFSRMIVKRKSVVLCFSTKVWYFSLKSAFRYLQHARAVSCTNFTWSRSNSFRVDPIFLSPWQFSIDLHPRALWVGIMIVAFLEITKFFHVVQGEFT